MPRHWFMGSCYLVISALNIHRFGFGSPNWIPWVLLTAGVLTVAYTPVEQNGKTRQKLVMSGRNKASFVVTGLGGLLLLGLVVFQRRH
jgi:hypothetical protein